MNFFTFPTTYSYADCFSTFWLLPVFSEYLYFSISPWGFFTFFVIIHVKYNSVTNLRRNFLVTSAIFLLHLALSIAFSILRSLLVRKFIRRNVLLLKKDWKFSFSTKVLQIWQKNNDNQFFSEYFFTFFMIYWRFMLALEPCWLFQW